MLGLQGNGLSQGLELATSYQLTPRQLFMAQMSVSSTCGVEAQGLLNGVSTKRAQGLALGWLASDVWLAQDQLTLTIKQPLRLNSGSIDLWLASVDSQGQALYHNEKISLVPSGRALDFRLAYDTPLSAKQTLSVHALYRQDVQHVQGMHDASLGALWRMQF